MKATSKILVLLALGAGLCQAAAALELGQRAPELAATVGGAPLRLASMKGQVVYVDFWASWCGPCKQSFPWLNEMQAKYGAKGLRVIAINLDQRREDAERFLAQVPAKFQIAYDSQGATPTAYGVKTMPSSVLIGADGRVVHLNSGFRDDEAADLEARIATALSARK